MTPLERSELYFKGEEVDRLPCGLLGIETGCTLYDITPRECLNSLEKGIEVQEHLIEDLEVDSIGYGPDLKGIAEALGTEIIYPENSICYVENPVLKDYKQLDELKEKEFLSQGRLPIILEFLNRMKEKYGKTRSVDNMIAGPMSTVAAIRGTENLLKDMRKNKENLHALLNFAVDVNLKWIQHVWNACEAGVSIADPVASGDLLGYERFCEFEKPYLQRLSEGILEITGKKPSLHICGRTNMLWEEFKELGISGFALDNCENLEEFKQTVGNDITISGNISPTEVMRFGTPKDVTEALKKCLKEGSDSLKGYIPGAGCQIPLGTPMENLVAYVNGVKKYTKGARLGKQIIDNINI